MKLITTRGRGSTRLAARLVEMLADVGQFINQDLLAAEDPLHRKVAAELGNHAVGGYVGRSQTSSPDYRPVTRQIRRWIEARFHESSWTSPRRRRLGSSTSFEGSRRCTTIS